MSIHISKNSNGLYDVRVFSTHLDAFGKRKSKFKSNIKGIKNAKLLGDEFQEILDSDTKSNLTFKELHELYINSRENKISITTLNAVTTFTPVVEYFGNVKIENINNRLAQQYIDYRQSCISKNSGKRLKKSTVMREYSHLRAVINWAVANDYLMYNRIVRVEYAPDDEEFEPTLLSIDMIAKILTTLKRDYYNLYIPILLCSTTGLRRSEALGLKWENVDLDNNLIKITKSVSQVNNKLFEKSNLKTKSSKRILYISEFLKNELIQHRQMNALLNSDYVCATIFTGTIPTPSNLTHKFPDFVKKEFGIDIRLHDLRHSFNQILYEQGVDSETRASILGHSSTKTTETIYTHNSMQLIANALEHVGNSFSKL